MFSKKLFLQPLSGFVEFAPGAHHPLAPAPAPAAANVDEGSGWAGHVATRPTWQSPAGGSVRRVEMAILASVCAYFAFGLGSALGLY